MAFTGNFMCNSFKVELMTATHDFTVSTGHAFYLALYDNVAAFTAATTDYTATNETSGTNYVAGGGLLVNAETPNWDVAGGTPAAITDFDDEVWGTASFSAYGGMIYNSTAGTNSVVILDFGGIKTATAGDFTVQFPVPDSDNAIIRIA